MSHQQKKHKKSLLIEKINMKLLEKEALIKKLEEENEKKVLHCIKCDKKYHKKDNKDLNVCQIA